MWPPNSLDLNPVDYKIWSVVQERVYQQPISNIEELHERIVSVWEAHYRHSRTPVARTSSCLCQSQTGAFWINVAHPGLISHKIHLVLFHKRHAHKLTDAKLTAQNPLSSIGACWWRCSCECPPSCSVLSSPKPWREAKIKLAQIFLHRS